MTVSFGILCSSPRCAVDSCARLGSRARGWSFPARSLYLEQFINLEKIIPLDFGKVNGLLIPVQLDGTLEGPIKRDGSNRAVILTSFSSHIIMRLLKLSYLSYFRQ